MITAPSNTPDSSTIADLPTGRQLAEIVLIVLVFFTIAGDPPPHVNESHYLARLKHYWNPQWCAGDLFLESKDAQVVFVWTFGWVTRWLSLAATAWVGRLLTWTFLAWAWQRLSWRLIPRPFAAVLSATLFVALNQEGHLAGEWVVGGVESKCVAYGFVLVALRGLIDHRWNGLWLSLGAATAFHPLVGGWSTVVCSAMVLLKKGDWSIFDILRGAPSPSRNKNGPVPFIGAVGGALLALLGIVPALMLTWNEPPELVAEAGRIYVFDRLPHHLAPLTLPAAEVVRRLGGHAAVLIALLLFVRALPKLTATKTATSSPSMGRLAQFAFGAALLAAIGFAIELVLWNQPLLAARLLRYYWFRLTDFAAPMAAALYITALIAVGIERRRTWAVWILTAVFVLAGFFLVNTTRQRALNPTPPADNKIRDFAAWVDACGWVAENTPADALFLTPRLNLSFKWRAGRAEVVNRKDIPQDARSIVEWHQRIKEIYYATIEGEEQPLDSLGILGTQRVRELAIKYRADYVIMDRGQLLSLPRVYPTRENPNEEYVVYRIDERELSHER